MKMDIAYLSITYNMDQIVKSCEYVETGQKTGNFLLKVADWNIEC